MCHATVQNNNIFYIVNFNDELTHCLSSCCLIVCIDFHKLEQYTNTNKVQTTQSHLECVDDDDKHSTRDGGVSSSLIESCSLKDHFTRTIKYPDIHEGEESREYSLVERFLGDFYNEVIQTL